jgi:hypothetical protein
MDFGAVVLADSAVYMGLGGAVIGSFVDYYAGYAVMGMTPLMSGALIGAAAGVAAVYGLKAQLIPMLPILMLAAVGSTGGLIALGLGFNPLWGVVGAIGVGFLAGSMDGKK